MLPTIEVDTADDYQGALACERAIGRTLVTLGRAKKPPRVTVYAYESPSVNFGSPTNSIFLGVAGPERILVVLRAVIGAVAGVRCRYGDYIQADRCIPRFHLEKGVLWLLVDGNEWESSESSESADAPPPEEPAPDSLQPAQGGTPEATLQTLIVARKDLEHACRLMSAAKGTGVLNLTFDGEDLELRRGRTRAPIRAQGHWSGTARISMASLRDILKRIDTLTKQVKIAREGTWLKFGEHGIAATWS